MSTLTKVFVVMNAVVTIALSVLFVAGAAQWQNSADLIDKYRAQVDAEQTLRTSVSNAAGQALALKDDEISELSRQLSAAESSVASLNAELTGSKAALATTESKLQGAEASRTSLEQMLNVNQGELNALRSRHQNVLNQNQELQTRNERLNNRTLELTTNVSILTDQIRNLQEKLYACERGAATRDEAIALSTPVSPALTSAVPNATPTRPTVAAPIHGAIVAVSDRYAEIGVGEADGVRPGMTFLIYREGGQYLGELIVETVQAHKAGGRLSSGMANNIRRGDLVAYGIE